MRNINRLLRLGLALFVLAACAPAVAYTPPTVIAPDQRIGAPRSSDSARKFFDSLAVERRNDVARRTVTDASLNSFAWLDIIRDTTLAKLIDVAVQQNTNVRIAVARINEYRANVGIARSSQLPSVTLSASTSANEVPVPNASSVSYRATRLTADLAWEVDFWGRIRGGVDAANADLGGQQAAQRATVLSLVGDVASGYLRLLELDQEREIAERTLSTRKSTLEIARARFASGLTSELDVRQFEAQVAAPAVTLAQAERNRSQAEHNLNVLLGEAPTNIRRGAPLNQVVSALIIPDSLPAALLARRPDVVQAERAYAAAMSRVGVADAARWPTISIGGSLGGQTGTPADILGSQSRVYQALVGITFPLFDNARLASVSAAARARAEQARASYEGVALNALREANDALVGVRTARDEAVAQATQANALRIALELATLRYQAGLATYLDLLDAQRSLFGAELALSQAQQGELTSAVTLYKALGGSWVVRP